MNTQIRTLFIVDNNQVTASKLEQSLYNRFGTSLKISRFQTGESCLDKINTDTNIVVLSYFLEGQNGNEILKSIKLINPKTEVIMLSANDNIATIVESFRDGATDYVIKDDRAWRRIVPHVYRIVSEPIRRFGKEYGAKAYALMFIIAFATVGFGSYGLMKMFSY